jgi:multiple sugar transport system substrate-binding protein
MMKRSKRRIAALAAIGLVASIAATAAPAQAADVHIKLVMASYTDAMTSYYTDLITRFQAANPGIIVDLDVVSWPEIGQKVKTLIASGQSPDVVNNDEFAGEAAAGLLYKANEIVSPSTLADIIPAFMTNSEYKGVAYAVPDLASARAFFYNKAILKGAGVAKPPATWADLTAAAVKIKAKYPSVYPLGLPFGVEEAQAEFTVWGGGNGARLYNAKTGKYTINTKKYLDSLLFLKGLVDKKLTQPNPGKTNRTDGAWTLFAKGKVAMVDGGVFLPDWLQKNGGAKISWGAAPFPHAPGQSDITLGVQDYFKGYKANGHVVEIRKFLDFLFVAANYQGFLKAAGGFIPATKSAGAIAAKDKIIGPYIALLPKAIFYPGTVGSWSVCKSAIITYMGTAMLNPQKSLTAIQKKCDAASATP